MAEATSDGSPWRGIDLSAMYDETDPALACEMAQEAIGNLYLCVGVVVVTM